MEAKSQRNWNLGHLALIAGVAGMTVLPVFGAVTAIVAGHIALANAKRNGVPVSRLAVAGVLLGYLGIVAVFALLIWTYHVISGSP